jgi:prepilin-type N-terminal cleavage/methylation domain-containing protein
MKQAFSIVELMIVVAILGILAAIVVPQFQSHATQAKEATAKDNLRVLRSAIELYAAKHTGVAPGYKDNDPTTVPSSDYFRQQTTVDSHYFVKMPLNPFNNLDTIKMIGSGESFPAGATGNFGWIYKPATETIRLDWPGVDDDGIRYYDY